MTEIPLQSSETLDGFCVQMQVGVLREWINVDIEPANSSETSTRSSRFMALKEGAANMVSRAVSWYDWDGFDWLIWLILDLVIDLIEA